MIPEVSAILGFVAASVGVAYVFINARLGSFKLEIDALKKDLGNVTTRLIAVETERDSAKKDLDNCKDNRIAVLEENRFLRKTMSACATCKNARP